MSIAESEEGHFLRDDNVSRWRGINSSLQTAARLRWYVGTNQCFPISFPTPCSGFNNSVSSWEHFHPLTFVEPASAAVYGQCPLPQRRPNLPLTRAVLGRAPCVRRYPCRRVCSAWSEGQASGSSRRQPPDRSSELDELPTARSPAAVDGAPCRQLAEATSSWTEMSAVMSMTADDSAAAVDTAGADDPASARAASSDHKVRESSQLQLIRGRRGENEHVTDI